MPIQSHHTYNFELDYKDKKNKSEEHSITFTNELHLLEIAVYTSDKSEDLFTSCQESIGKAACKDYANKQVKFTNRALKNHE